MNDGIRNRKIKCNVSGRQHVGRTEAGIHCAMEQKKKNKRHVEF
jgi:hypothetical protein